MPVELERPGNLTDVARALEWVWSQLVRLEQGFNLPQDFITLKELHTEPARLYTGLTVLADGSDWNPGSGQGVYTYYDGAWHKLG
jgi:hypothetical protein